MTAYRYNDPRLSEETAYGIWSQLRRQIENVATTFPGDPLNENERKLYEILTRRFACQAVEIGHELEKNEKP